MLHSPRTWSENHHRIHAIPEMVPAEIIVLGSAIPLLLSYDDPSAAIHDLAGEGIPVTVIVDSLDVLGLDIGDLPAYVYAAADLRDALHCARKRGHIAVHWL